MRFSKTNLLISIILVLLLHPSFIFSSEKPQEAGGLTVEKIFAGSGLSGTLPSNILWLPGGEGISYLADRKLSGQTRTVFAIRDVPSGEERVICIPDTFPVPEDLKSSDDTKLSFDDYIWSESGDRVAFLFEGDIFTFEPASGRLTRLTKTGDPESNLAFSPDGSMLAYTRENDLYFLNESGREVRITSTGADTLYNGVLNWVYMEELFTRGNRSAFWWSPDNRAIAFMEIDDGRVPGFPLVDWLPTHCRMDRQHYPKAGDPNPRVRIGVFEIASGELFWLDPLGEEDGYIARVHWLADGRRLALEELNRDQNRLRLIFGDYASGRLGEVLEETDSTWVGVNYIKYYYKTKAQFIWGSERDGYAHLYMFGEDGLLMRQLDEDAWTTTSLDAVDEEAGIVYFTALEKSILERHLYRISEQGREIRRLSNRPGSHSVRFSPNCKYYLDYFSNAETPTEASVHDAMGRLLFTFGEPPEEANLIASLPKPEFFTITSEVGITFQCQMIKPVDFNPKRKYPVIIYTYGGPNAQVVQNAWGRNTYLWHCLMTERGYIIFSLDNRGSFGRGRSWENTVFHRLGQLELADQMTGVKYLKTLPYVDSQRIGIWGWSYGGFMTCLAMFKHSAVFKAGAAVAPVADFRLYDSIYTERYMGLPADNEGGYSEGAPLSFADQLGSALLIAHGTADDNVHMQNTIVLADKLIKARKDFDLMLYPGKHHGIEGNDARVHLFNKLTSFFEKNL
jgi:dipeptidyl-peptidase-4